MKAYRTLLDLIKEIHELSSLPNPPYVKIALLWKKLYLYERQSETSLCSKMMGDENAKSFWKLYDQAKDAPIYFRKKKHLIEIMEEKPDVNPSDFATYQEELEFDIQNAIRIAMEKLKEEEHIDYQHSSLHHRCKFCSLIISKYLWSLGYFARMVSVEDCFSPDVCHMFCVVEAEGVPPYVVDVTYTQFCTVASCMKEARFQFEDAFIGPGYFIDSKEKEEIMDSFMKKGFFPCNDDTLKIYGDSFALAQQSFESGDRLKLVPPKTKTKEYLDKILNAPMIRK